MNTFTTLRSIAMKLILCSSLMLLTFCDTQEELVFDSSKDLLTQDAKIVQLLSKMATKNIASRGALKSGNTNPDCTGFLYPIVFKAFHGDDPSARQITVNSDEELLQFFSTTLTPENPHYVLFPVTLVDVEGTETIVYSLEDLENIIQIAIDICYGDDDSDGSDDDSDDGDNDGEDDADDSDDSDDSDSDYEYCDKNNKKVYICHKGITICVSVNAIWGHLEHHEEDFLGQCD